MDSYCLTRSATIAIISATWHQLLPTAEQIWFAERLEQPHKTDKTASHFPDSCAWKHKSGHSISEISQGFGQTVCGVYWHPETVGGFTAPPPPSKMMYYGHCTIMYHHLWNPLKSHRPLKSLKAILNLAATSRRSVRDKCIWWVLMVLAPLV